MNGLKEYVEKYYKEYFECSSGQLYIQYHITRICENRCFHCYFNELTGEKNAVSLKECKKVLNDIAITAQKLKIRPVVDFTGGDPLMHPSFWEIIQYSKKLRISVGIKCNSHLLTSEIVHRLKKEKVERIFLSLEGCEKINDSIRGKGDFKRTISALKKLKEEGMYVRIHMTLSQINYSEIIPVMQFFYDNNFVLDLFSWSRYWAKDGSQMLTGKQMVEVMEEQLTFIEKLYSDKQFYVELDNGKIVPRIGIEFKEHLWYPFLLEKGYIDERVSDVYQKNVNSLNCTSTRNVFIIDNNGDVLKCRKLEEMNIGNVKSGSLFDIIHNKRNKLCMNLKLHSECGKCKFYNVCAGCPAIAKAKKGSIYCTDPDCMFKNN